MQKDYTDITLIVDESGSMSPLTEDVIGSINTFIKDQKEVKGKCVFTFTKFSDKVLIENPIDIHNFENFNYSPDGFTALLDAIGLSIDKAGKRFNEMSEDERPDKVIFVILTDGMENSSREYNREQIFNMIKEQEEKYNWTFIYLGANQDAIAVGSTFNVNSRRAMTYSNNEKGLANCLFSASAHVATYRTTGDLDDLDFSVEDREKAMEGD
ncbi:MAG: von Willebrand factor type A domain protein [candidate division CPR1 bacterium ADurb.Bin160]|uniref:von Willebrand factor type A domain protein n=1 Tax=candidate division CPR1 bacterium ADurb.Bin160 TaxID=1852826 RepID=A0A1V5ZJG8_9BACT|nr:MAG: von Willebrand factor type A domain protein [candidate division CPR1 bacterium ADurb.Bin160]